MLDDLDFAQLDLDFVPLDLKVLLYDIMNFLAFGVVRCCLDLLYT